MATGTAESHRDADGASDAIAATLRGAGPLAVTAPPAPRQVVAAALLASARPDRAHVRVAAADRGPIAGDHPDRVATAAGLDGDAQELSSTDPLAHAIDVAREGEVDDGPATETATAVAASGDGTAGVVMTEPDVVTSLRRSVRLPRPSADATDLETTLSSAALPTTAAAVPGEEGRGRALGSWVTALTIDGDVPPGARAGLATALSPTRIDHDGAPTREGLLDVIEVLAVTAPGEAIAAVLTGDWATATERYGAAVDAVHDRLDGLARGADRPPATATIDEPLPLRPLTRLWVTYRLDAPYGLLVRGEGPQTVALGATGERSAAALLESATSRHGGVCWGDETAAGAWVPEALGDPAEDVRDAL